MSADDQSSHLIFETEAYNNEVSSSNRLQTAAPVQTVSDRVPIVSFDSQLKNSDPQNVQSNFVCNQVTENVAEIAVSLPRMDVRIHKQYRLLKKKSATKTSPSKIVSPVCAKIFRNRLKVKTNSPKKLKCILPKLVQKGKRVLRAKLPVMPPPNQMISAKPPSVPELTPAKKQSSKDLHASNPHLVGQSIDQSQQNTTNSNQITAQSQQKLQEDHLMAFLKASSTIEKCVDRKAKRRPRLNKQQKLLQDKIKALSYVPDLKSQEEALVVNYLIKVKKALVSMEANKFAEFVTCMNNFSNSHESPEKLYLKICEILGGFEELKEEFVMFLTPDQAICIGKYPEYCSILIMREFIDELKFHSNKQQQHLQKVTKALQSLQNRPNVTEKQFMDHMKPLLQFQPQLIDNLAQLFPASKPVNSLIEDFQVIKLDDQEPDEIENMILPDTGAEMKTLVENCSCKCHESTNSNLQASKMEHCISCGLRFIDGRVYFQYGKTPRPVKVSYVVDDEKEILVNSVLDDMPKTKSSRKTKESTSSDSSNLKLKQNQRKFKDKNVTNDEEKPKRGRGSKRKVEKISK